MKTGKTRMLKTLGAPSTFDWPRDRAIVSCFPGHLSTPQIVELLSSVGFNTVPSFLKPHHVLSSGEQYRATLARALAQRDPAAPTFLHQQVRIAALTKRPELNGQTGACVAFFDDRYSVAINAGLILRVKSANILIAEQDAVSNTLTLVDEFTSCLDRSVAMSTAYAFARAVRGMWGSLRSTGGGAIIASCHWCVLLLILRNVDSRCVFELALVMQSRCSRFMRAGWFWCGAGTSFPTCSRICASSLMVWGKYRGWC
jgi:hypothetical protein